MRRLVSDHRCPRCEIRKPLCFCSLIPQINTATRVIILMHTAEEMLTTNTARLAARALPNSDIRIHGKMGACISKEGIAQSDRPSLLLYPSSHARELNADFARTLTSPVNLIVPDGSWSQTRKFVRRESSLAGIPHVKLPSGPPSEYRLRIQPRETGLCTLEAIARALGILESYEARQQLETLLRVMVERTLWSRGMIGADECTVGGIPEEAFVS
ncbi:MAG: DTW domain-containing protein [Planctomycetales bacterium]|nr:DTW domain-containing protein [Planctomycetales bacterium]